MGFTDRVKETVYKPIAKATADYLREQALQKEANAPINYKAGIKRTQIDYNTYDNSLRRKPDSSIGFETLRRFSRSHEISRICINARKRQITGLDWDILPVDPEDKTDYSEDIDLIRAYFKNLGGYRMRFRELQDTLIEDLLVLDAAVLYKQRSRGGDILYYMPVDGSTIKLRVDEQGNTPMPPEIAYQQYIRGNITGEFTADEMIYEMMNPRTDTPYGLAPLESLILIVSSSLKGTLYNLDYLTAGNVPEGFLKLPDTWSTKQIEEFMTYFDALMSGNSKETTKVKAVAGDYIPSKKRDDMAFKDFNNWLMQVTCAMFDVQPQEIGFTMDVNKSTGSEQNAIATRKGILPLANLLTEIWNDIIQIDLGFPQLQFKYNGLEDRDALAEAQTKQIQLAAGYRTIDEVRKEEGYDPLGITMPYVAANGVTFLTDATITPREEDELGEDKTSTEAHGTQTAESGPSELIPDKTLSAQDELRKFRTYAVKRIKDGKQLRKFRSDVLSPLTVDKLNRALTNCDDSEAAKRIIDSFRGNPDFLAKATVSGTNQTTQPNPHFAAILGTAGFAAFEAQFSRAIIEQAEWTAKNFKKVADSLLTSDTKMSADDIAKLEAWLYDNMPAISTFIKSGDVTDWYEKVVNQGVNSLYKSMGSDVKFNLTDGEYKKQLANRADMLLTKSTLDNTTRKQVASVIVKDRDKGMTVTEISKDINEQFKSISSVRANMIARTETINTLNDSQFKAMGDVATMKEWTPYGSNPCIICETNEDEGWIPMTAFFASGDLMPSAHTHCECGLDYDLGDTSLSDLWDGS